jgi:PAS domain S-box-containing protein
MSIEPDNLAGSNPPDTVVDLAGQDQDALRLLIKSVRDYAIFMLDPGGFVQTWNSGAEAMKGYKAHEIIGQHFSKFYPQEAIAKGWPAHELRMATAEGRFEDEGWRLRKDGSKFWANVVITAVRNSAGDLAGFGKVTRDMTERRLREEEIRGLNANLNLRIEQLAESNRMVEERTVALHNLSAKLLNIQDEERRRIARELHEGLSQELTAMEIIFHSAIAQKKFDPDTQAAITEGLGLAERVARGIRSVSYLLHPPLLDEAGLRSALPWLIEGFAKSSSIEVSLEFIPAEFPRLSKQVETAIFRIAQEALANVLHHSGSPKAQVIIEKTLREVSVRVRDYGKGFALPTAERLDATAGVGVGGMRERAAQLGGELKITLANPGTLLEAKFPSS